jgi:hypothetical protein
MSVTKAKAFGSDQIRLLVNGGWSSEAEAAVSAGGFDQLELQRGSYTDLAFLAPLKENVRSLWINAPLKKTEGLSELTGLERLKISYPPEQGSLNLEGLKSLKDVVLDEWVDRFRAFTTNDKIRSLRIAHYPGDDLAGFQLPNLESLDLIQGKLVSLEGLARLPKLASLGLSHQKKLVDISSVGSCTHLRKLELREALPALTEMSAVFGLKNLQELDVRGFSSELRDVHWVKELKHLRVLLLPAVTEIDWHVVFSLTSLQKLLIPSAVPTKFDTDEIVSIANDHGRNVARATKIGTKKRPGWLLEFAI